MDSSSERESDEESNVADASNEEDYQLHGVWFSDLHEQEHAWLSHADALWHMTLGGADDSDGHQLSGRYGANERDAAVESYWDVLSAVGLGDRPHRLWINSMLRARRASRDARLQAIPTRHLAEWQALWRAFAESLQGMVFFAHVFIALNPDLRNSWTDETPPEFPPDVSGSPGWEWYINELDSLAALVSNIVRTGNAIQVTNNWAWLASEEVPSEVPDAEDEE